MFWSPNDCLLPATLPYLIWFYINGGDSLKVHNVVSGLFMTLAKQVVTRCRTFFAFSMYCFTHVKSNLDSTELEVEEFRVLLVC